MQEEHKNFTIKVFYDSVTYTLTYVVYDPQTKDALLIDSVLDYDSASGQYSYDSAKKVAAFIKERGLKLHYILETHAHADHLSASVYLKGQFPSAKIGIGKNIQMVQKVFTGLFNIDIPTDGSQFDQLFNDEEKIKAGSLSFKVLFTPGHTPACTSILMDDVVFTGDSLFMPDYGTGRCDFPEGSAEDLYNSITGKLYTLSDDTVVYTGHDYQPGGRELMYRSSIAAEKAENIRLNGDTTKADFVKFRSERDATLNAPRLLLPSIQVNIDAGQLPRPEANGMSYLKLPLREKK